VRRLRKICPHASGLRCKRGERKKLGKKFVHVHYLQEASARFRKRASLPCLKRVNSYGATENKAEREEFLPRQEKGRDLHLLQSHRVMERRWKKVLARQPREGHSGYWRKKEKGPEEYWKSPGKKAPKLFSRGEEISLGLLQKKSDSLAIRLGES